MSKHVKFHKIKGERGGMSFSQFCGYSSDSAAKNARDKMAKQLTAEGKTFKLSKTLGYAGGTIFPVYKITNVKRK
jgi:hypothetical protein